MSPKFCVNINMMLSKHNIDMISTRESLKVVNTNTESLDFEELESVMWRKHQLRRFFQDRGFWWTNSRRTTARKWTLVILLGLSIGLIGYFVSFLTNQLFAWKFDACKKLVHDKNFSAGFFLYWTFSLFYSIVAGALTYFEPTAAGGGIPEIKAYLNGINLNTYVRVKTLFVKVFGMCFSVAAGLPLGKEGPMIHSGAIVGAALSQGKSLTFGFDTSWTKFQDLRNDKSKRDFVTFGAAAGVTAAFNAPIGGILFTLEEGASYWSTSLTFRGFFCSMITQLTLNILYSGFTLGTDRGNGLFAFGLFSDFGGFKTYELFIFVLIGMGGGLLGALFNEHNRQAALFRRDYVNTNARRFIELLVITSVMTFISFLFPLMWNTCTTKPTDTADWSSSQVQLLDQLERFQCGENEYNEVASLFFVPADITLQQLFHFKEVDGTSYTTFSTGALLLFFFPYFIIASIIGGAFCPAGLFVPTLIAGATLGRVVGHILNTIAPGYVTDSGSYALIGASALMGGMSRLTIAGTVIVLEASGNSEYLLPLMLTFAAARYTGNAINEPLYDLMIHLKRLPFLDGSLKTLGLLNYHPIIEIIAQPVVTLNEINKVSEVHKILTNRTHNGFPVISSDGHLRGLILRKQLCTLLKLKAFSAAIDVHPPSSSATTPHQRTTSRMPSSIQLAPAATVFYDTMERGYPNYPKIGDIILTNADMECWLDIRPYMDSSPFTINVSSSIQRCYRFFRTMGLRHLIVLDGDHRVTGMITRKDITEIRLEHHWYHEGENMQKYINVDPAVRTGVLHESDSLLFSSTSLHEREDLENSSGRGYPDTTAGRTSTNSAGHFSGINPLNKAASSSSMGNIYIPPGESSPAPSTIPSTVADGLSMNPLQSPSQQPVLSPGGMMVQPASIVSSSSTDQKSSDKARKSLKEPKTVRYK